MEPRDTIIVRFKCPKCGESITSTLKKSDLDFKGGIASVSLLHGSPPHVAIVYIDLNGEVRGVEVPEVTLQVGTPATEERAESIELTELEEIDVDYINRVIDREFIERALVYIIADRPTYFVFQEIDESYYRALEELARAFGNETKVLRDNLADFRALVAVSSSFYLKNESIITKDCVIYTITKKMRCHSPKSKTFSKLVKQHLSSSEKAKEFATVLRYYLNLTEIAYDVIKKHRRLKKKELAKLANIPSKDLDLIVDCLIAKGITVEKDVLIFS